MTLIQANETANLRAEGQVKASRVGAVNPSGTASSVGGTDNPRADLTIHHAAATSQPGSGPDMGGLTAHAEFVKK